MLPTEKFWDDPPEGWEDFLKAYRHAFSLAADLSDRMALRESDPQPVYTGAQPQTENELIVYRLLEEINRCREDNRRAAVAVQAMADAHHVMLAKMKTMYREIEDLKDGLDKRRP